VSLQFYLAKLYADLASLAPGIEVVDSTGNKVSIPVTMSGFASDALGANELVGLRKGFNIYSFTCRYCGATGLMVNGSPILQGHFIRRECLHSCPAALVTYRNILQNTDLDKKATNILGIQEPFYVTRYFKHLNPFNSCGPDRFHDTAQGVVSDFLRLVVFPSHRQDKSVMVRAINRHRFYHGRIKIEMKTQQKFKYKNCSGVKVSFFIILFCSISFLYSHF